jgi:MYXO-CTERM domain-containing protein
VRPGPNTGGTFRAPAWQQWSDVELRHAHHKLAHAPWSTSEGEVMGSYRKVAWAALALTLGLESSARADVVTQWNQVAIQAVKTAGLTPNTGTRALAITQIAVYDALTAIERKYEPYHDGKLVVPNPVSPEAAALAAANYALVVLFPAQRTLLNQQLATDLQKLPKGAARDNGVKLGQAAAGDILQLRAAGSDGSLNAPAYPGDATTLGKWRPTPPKNLAAQDPGWGTVTPFAIPSASAYRPAAPPAITTAAYATDFEEVRALGAATGSTRTTDQTTIAQFWVFPTHIPYNAIARQISAARGLSLFDNARLFALLNIALADARIAAWDAKYSYGAWRPITAITSPTDDGNTGTTEDPTWLPLLETPNHPEYPSGHSTTGAAGATVLASWFGDEVDFSVASDSLPDTTRVFASLWQSAKENGRSRIYGGIHFQYANAAGLTLGQTIGQYVYDNLLLPLPVPVEEDAGVLAALDAGRDAGPAALVDAGHTHAVVDAGTHTVVDAGESGSVDAATSKKDAGGSATVGDAGLYLTDAAADVAAKKSDNGGLCSVSQTGGHTGTTVPLLLLGAALALGARRRRNHTRAR